MTKVIQHGVRCPGCGAELYSNSRHDLVACGCPLDTFIDGGFDYQRVGARDKMSEITAISREVDRAKLPAYHQDED